MPGALDLRQSANDYKHPYEVHRYTGCRTSWSAATSEWQGGYRNLPYSSRLGREVLRVGPPTRLKSDLAGVQIVVFQQRYVQPGPRVNPCVCFFPTPGTTMQLAGRPRLQLPWAESNATSFLTDRKEGGLGARTINYKTLAEASKEGLAVLQLLYCNDKETENEGSCCIWLGRRFDDTTHIRPRPHLFALGFTGNPLQMCD
ncbi:hypothetical protein PoMZ_03971 [Pyricularia oryzae]|uniref:Uncharacterized protein n=1 Tax=Pyricularia oryzae TaxID=318829 RepID=A0A4P7NBV9_PYROR|nr:hypothetical protein PoMZ_03971 [Pyricularia oryzae]